MDAKQASEKRKSKLTELIKRSQTLGINLFDLPAIKNHPNFSPQILSRHTRKLLFRLIVTIASTWIIYLVVKYFRNTENECVISSTRDISMAFRPPINCDFCAGITEVERITRISPEEFRDRFAYSGRPVVVTDATQNWTALKVTQQLL